VNERFEPVRKGLALEERLHHLLRLGRREIVQVDFLIQARQGLPPLVREQLEGVPPGTEEDGREGRIRDQKPHQVNERRVGPVEVFQPNHRRLGPGGRFHELVDGREQLRLPQLRAPTRPFGRIRAIEAAKHRTDLRRRTQKALHASFELAPDRCRGISFLDFPEPVQKADQGRIRDTLSVSIGMGGNPMKLKPLLVESGPEFFHQPGLARARVARDADDRSLSRLQPFKSGSQQAQLGLPPDERRA